MNNYIAYYRVSTERQGRSGLGLEAQREIVHSFVTQTGGQLIGEHVEVESGKRCDRPELEKALAECKKNHATLLIAKLDRLARNVHFISGLMESGVEFVAADNPHANRLMVHLLAAFAEHERDMISKRTKEALAAAKARGIELGRNGHVLARKNRERACKFSTSLRGVVDDIQSRGSLTLASMADELNCRGVSTPRGTKWYPATVKRLLEHLAAA
jgi:DNA invertase Pin-like site-specific DNA recombinase